MILGGASSSAPAPVAPVLCRRADAIRVLFGALDARARAVLLQVLSHDHVDALGDALADVWPVLQRSEALAVNGGSS